MLRRICQSDRRIRSAYTKAEMPNSKCFSNQNNHGSCSNLTHVLNMSNNFKELLKRSTSLLVVYPMLFAFAEAVGDVKL